jgi:hypothetical protein
MHHPRLPVSLLRHRWDTRPHLHHSRLANILLRRQAIRPHRHMERILRRARLSPQPVLRSRQLVLHSRRLVLHSRRLVLRSRLPRLHSRLHLQPSLLHRQRFRLQARHSAQLLLRIVRLALRTLHRPVSLVQTQELTLRLVLLIRQRAQSIPRLLQRMDKLALMLKVRLVRDGPASAATRQVIQGDSRFESEPGMLHYIWHLVWVLIFVMKSVETRKRRITCMLRMKKRNETMTSCLSLYN